MQALIKQIEIDREDGALFIKADEEFTDRFLVEDFFVKYPSSVDLTTVPRSLLIAPFLLNVAPVVWRSGLHFTVADCDEVLAESLRRIHVSLRRLYPNTSWDGEVIFEDSVAVLEDADPAVGSLLLYSGGLDSTFSAFQMRDQDVMLLTIWGGHDLRLSTPTAWETVSANARSFAEEHDFCHSRITSNFTDFLSDDVRRMSPLPGTSWWASVQHGLGLAGLAIPLAESKRRPRLVVSATHTHGHEGGWGSHPQLDGDLFWGNKGAVDHFGYEYSRADKTRLIADTCRIEGVATPNLLVCTSNDRLGNCLTCPKCLRTMGGLLVEGENPSEYGFTDRATAIELTTSRIPGPTPLGKNEVFAWGSLQRRARELLSDGQRLDDQFLTWLAACDLERVSSRYRWRRRIADVMRPARSLARRGK